MGSEFGRLGRSALTLGCALFAMTWIACGSGDDSAGAGASSSAPGEKGTRAVAMPGTESDPQKVLIGTGEIPEGFPDDIPMPTNAETQNAMVIPNQGGLVTFVSPDSRDDLVAHFLSELQGRGWSVDQADEDRRTLLKAKKGARSANVTVVDADNGTEIAVTFEGV